MAHHVHHVHIFASDLDRSIAFYREQFLGRVVLDMEVAGARNVFMRVGTGRIHFYDQAPVHPVRGNIHHFGIQTDDIAADVARMKEKGIAFRKPVTDLGYMKYVMVPAPDDILIELFEVNREALPPGLVDYFDWP
ncbi:MAG: VOC family protein [Thermodesulfobacteriota bacterium]